MLPLWGDRLAIQFFCNDITLFRKLGFANSTYQFIGIIRMVDVKQEGYGVN